MKASGAHTVVLQAFEFIKAGHSGPEMLNAGLAGHLVKEYRLYGLRSWIESREVVLVVRRCLHHIYGRSGHFQFGAKSIMQGVPYDGADVVSGFDRAYCSRNDSNASSNSSPAGLRLNVHLISSGTVVGTALGESHRIIEGYAKQEQAGQEYREKLFCGMLHFKKI